MRPRLPISPLRLALALAPFALTPACAPFAAPSPVAPVAQPIPAAERTEGTVPSSDGVPIHYVNIGTQRTAVVFVHCWGCNLGEWDATMTRLAPRTHVVAIDLAGHGASGRGRKEWTIRSFADDVRAVVERLGLERVVLVGHSMGGPVVVDAALAMPGRVVGVVPVDTLLDVSERMTAEQRAKFSGAMRADFKGQTEKLVRSLFPKKADPALVDRIVAQELAGDPAILVPAVEDAFAYPEAERLGQLKVPVHAVNADLYPTNIAGNKKVLPAYGATIVHDAGHWLMLEKPAEFAAALDEALASIPM